jgi:hypothetical protein
LLEEIDTVRDVLREGGSRARQYAGQVLERASRACGVWSAYRSR